MNLSFFALYFVGVSLSAQMGPFHLEGVWGTGGVRGVALHNDLAFAAGYGAGMDIYDLSGPIAQVANVDTDGLVMDVAVSNGFVYALTLSGLHVFDIASPLQPTLVASVAELSGTRLSIDNGLMGIVGPSDGFMLASVQPNGVPSLESSIDGQFYAVVLAPNRAYICSNNQLLVYDTAAPASPAALSLTSVPGRPRGMDLVGTQLFLAQLDDGLGIYNVANAASPSLVGSEPLTGSCFSVTVVGNYAYVGTINSDLFHVVDVQQASSPSLSQTLDLEGDHLVSVYHAGLNQLVVAQLHQGLRVLDLSNAANPADVFLAQTSGIAFGGVWDGNYFYLAHWDAGLKVLDVTDPTAPALAGALSLAGSLRSIAYAGGYVYAGSQADGLFVVDVSVPSAPVAVTQFPLSGVLESLVIVDQKLYVANREGFHVLDISNPAAPSIIGSVDSMGSTQSVFIFGNVAYVASYEDNGGLYVVDISDPAQPSVLGSLGVPNTFLDLDAQGTMVFLAGVGLGLAIADASDPMNPAWLGNSTPLDSAFYLALKGSTIFASDNLNWFSVIDASNPLAPVETDRVSTAGSVFDFVFHNEYTTILDGVSGQVRIYRNCWDSQQQVDEVASWPAVDVLRLVQSFNTPCP